MPKDPISALKGLIEDELTALERVVQEMKGLLSVCAQPPTRTELRAMASMLHEFYNGVERIFQRIATSLGGGDATRRVLARGPAEPDGRRARRDSAGGA